MAEGGISLQQAALLCLALVVGALQVRTTYAQAKVNANWMSFGGNNWNHRSAVTRAIKLPITPLFTINTGGADVSCTPMVSSGFVYFSDWAGKVYKANATSGVIAWQATVNTLVWPGGVPAEYGSVLLVSRITPTFANVNGVLAVIIGTQPFSSTPGGRFAWMLALRQSDGAVIWRTDVSGGHPYAIVTSSPTVFKGAVYNGLSSNEEAAAAKGLPCCSFRGQLFKLSQKTGAIQWISYIVPENGGVTNYTGFSGNAVWSSQPTIDEARNLVYFTSGNNYEVPAAVEACIKATNDPQAQSACVSVADNWFDSVIATDMTTGKVVWARRMAYYDIYTAACKLGFDCPFKESPDYDFGQCPLFLPAVSCPAGDGTNVTRDILLAAQKSGGIFGFDPSNPQLGGDWSGRLFWTAFSGIGSAGGGHVWGSAYDGSGVVFLQNNNNNKDNVTLVNPAPGSPKWTKAGFATAVDVCTGAIKWQAAAPNEAKMFAAPTYALMGSTGYVFFPTLASDGLMVVLRAATGAVHTTFAAGPGSVASGPAIANNILYVGAGYNRYSFGVGPGKFVAFKLTN